MRVSMKRIVTLLAAVALGLTLSPGAEAEQKIALLRSELRVHGRDGGAFGLEGWLRMHEADPQRWGAAAEGWRGMGADYVMLYPMYRMPTLEDQIATLRRFRDVAGG